MNKVGLKGGLFALVCALGPCLEANAEETVMSKSPTRLAVKVTGLKFRNKVPGVLRVALYSSADGFPDDPAKAIVTQTIDLGEAFERSRGKSKRDSQALDFVLELEEPQKRTAVALSILHDEDSSGVLETGLFGIPKEGIGFSNNPSIWGGKPDFKDCSVAPQDEATPIPVEMFYF